MNTLLSKNAFEAISAIKNSLQKENIISSPPIKKDYNYEITAQKGVEKCKILVYFGKKGVKTILQGNELASLYRQIEGIIFNKLPFAGINQEPDEPENYIGTDESGKGDLFGPLVIAAVHVNKKIIEQLCKAGVRDSKEIKNGKISLIANEIENITEGNYSILVLAPPEYNLLYSRYLNLNKMLNAAHSQVIETLLKKTDSPTIITDQFSKTALSISSNTQFAHKNFIQIPKGEKYTGVAAASILARDRFEKWFTEQENSGLYLLKGASSEVEKQAKEILHSYGKETLIRLAKKHFKPITNLIKN